MRRMWENELGKESSFNVEPVDSGEDYIKNNKKYAIITQTGFGEFLRDILAEIDPESIPKLNTVVSK